MMLYVENSKDHQKLLELINTFIYVTGYKINIQNSVTFLNITSELSEREIKKIIPLKIA